MKAKKAKKKNAYLAKIRKQNTIGGPKRTLTTQKTVALAKTTSYSQSSSISPIKVNQEGRSLSKQFSLISPPRLSLTKIAENSNE